jgi:hypothetical protein
MNRKVILTFATAIVAVATLSLPLHAADDEAISDAMKEYHKAPKGTDPVAKKAAKGEASSSEVKKLLKAYESMAKVEPPRGDAEAWKARLDTLIAATNDLKDEKDGSVEAFAKAGDCKGCHNEHKPE